MRMFQLWNMRFRTILRLKNPRCSITSFTNTNHIIWEVKYWYYLIISKVCRKFLEQSYNLSKTSSLCKQSQRDTLFKSILQTQKMTYEFGKTITHIDEL